MFLPIPRKDYGSFYLRVSRVPQVSTRKDKRGRNGVLRKHGGTKCECFAKRSLKVGNHLLSKGGQQATKATPHVPTPRLVVKVPAPFCYTSDKVVP